MDSVLSILTDVAADGGAGRFVFLALVAATICAATAAIGFFVFGASDPLRRRLASLTAGAPVERTQGPGIGARIEPVARHLLPAAQAERSAVQEKLKHAGLRSPNALSVYYTIKTLLGLSVPGIAYLIARFFPELESGEVYFIVAFAAFIGVMLPNIVLARLVDRRKRLLRNGFPDALDLLVVCVEAGLGLSAALARVGDELGVSHPELSTELALVNAETRAGVERVQALRNLAERTGLEDIRGLVTLLAQTMRFGTSVADTLRVYSEEFRDKRMQAAEEQAAKIGTKLIFPLTFCMFPGFFIVAIGPAVLKVMAALAGK